MSASAESSASSRASRTRLRRRLRHAIYRRFYRDSNPEIAASMLVAGTARSGTTWVAELIASELSGRLVFEPFQAELVQEFRRFHYFQYMRPDEEDEELRAFCARVFSGRIRDPWIDRYVDTLLPRFRVVKEIRANLFLGWLRRRFPQVPLLFIIRHPCAVVASRLALGWATDSDLAPILAQKPLVDDFLSGVMPMIRSARTPEQKHALIWCVTNLVPLAQVPPRDLGVVFYEDLCLDPEHQIPRLFRLLGHPLSGVPDPTRSSMTTRPGSRSEAGSIDAWRRQLGAAQIDSVLEIVQGFGLGDLYGDRSEPLDTARARFGTRR